MSGVQIPLPLFASSFELVLRVKNKALNEHVLNRFNDKKSVAEFIYFLHRQMENVSGQVFQLDSRVGRWI